MNAVHHDHRNRTEEALGLIRAAMDVLGCDQAHSMMNMPLQPVLASQRTVTVLSAEHIYKARSIRNEYLDADLFGEPAWDILLDLFIHRSKGKRLSITSSCIASRVPATTALRWIAILIERGLVHRTGDPADRQRAFVQLTEVGLEKMERFFERMESDRLGCQDRAPYS